MDGMREGGGILEGYWRVIGGDSVGCVYKCEVGYESWSFLLSCLYGLVC